MIVDLDTTPGKVVVRDSESILGLTQDVWLTPDQARAIAANLEAKGEHTVTAEGLRRAADDAEKRG